MLYEYNTQNHWGFLLCLSSKILNNQVTAFWNLICFCFQKREQIRDTYSLLPLKRKSFNYLTKHDL